MFLYKSFADIGKNLYILPQGFARVVSPTRNESRGHEAVRHSWATAVAFLGTFGAQVKLFVRRRLCQVERHFTIRFSLYHIGYLDMVLFA